MAPGRISKLPLELRLIIYDYCNIYPDRSRKGYSDPWSDLPRGHDINTRIDGVAIANLFTSFPELRSDLPEALSESLGLKTLVFSNDYGQRVEKDKTVAISHLDSLTRLLEMPAMNMTPRIAADIRTWNDYQLTSLFYYYSGRSKRYM